MRKNAIALLLAVVMVSGSLGAVPVSAAEPAGQEETGEEGAESIGEPAHFSKDKKNEEKYRLLAAAIRTTDEI